MKKQDLTAATTKLAFNKEKVASLSPADLDQIVGGDGDHSTHANFTCNMCTTLSGGSAVAEEV